MRVKPYAIRQHLIELGGGDVLQRMEMAQPSVADQRIASHRARRFGGRLDELTGACGRRRPAPIAGAGHRSKME
jgi:hypothetical protein